MNESKLYELIGRQQVSLQMMQQKLQEVSAELMAAKGELDSLKAEKQAEQSHA